MTQIRPLAGYVLVKRMEQPKQTASGIILAETTREEKSQRGEVVAVGATKEAGQNSQVQVGQTILFKKYGPVEVDLDGQEWLLVEEDEILAIVE